MRSLLYIGGPLILFVGLSLYTDLITHGEQDPGVIHFGEFAVVQQDTYMCDENGNNCVLVDSTTEVSEVEAPTPSANVSQSANYRLEEQSTGFSNIEGLQIEEQPIEYRDGQEAPTARKQPGLTKFGNLTLRRPSGFDFRSFQFTFPDFRQPSETSEPTPEPPLRPVGDIMQDGAPQ